MLATLEFDRTRKSMSVLTAPSGAPSPLLLVKGAAECVLARATRVMLPDGSVVGITPEIRANMVAGIEAMASKALRTLALAIRTDLPPAIRNMGGTNGAAGRAMLADPATYDGVESDLTMLGLVGLVDPPRREVKDAIEQCSTAGIRVMVITGDNRNTAEAICRQIGVFEPDEELSGKSMIGKATPQRALRCCTELSRPVTGCAALCSAGVRGHPVLMSWCA